MLPGLADASDGRSTAQADNCDPFQEAGSPRAPGSILVHCPEASGSLWKGNATKITFTGKVTLRDKVVAG